MKAATVIVTLVLLGGLALPSWAAADERYHLRFIPTHNAPGGALGSAEGEMTIRVANGHSTVRLGVRGLYPETVYTIWIVFNKLTWVPGTDPGVPRVASMSAGDAWDGFPAEGNGVAPTAKISSRFTDGMGLDPGATFRTDRHGRGQIEVKLDFDLVNAAPIGNKDIINQCVATPEPVDPLKEAPCPAGTRKIRVTTTWLRTFIGEYPEHERALMCANYDPRFDKGSGVYDAELANESDARLWQCVDPETGMPRVPRFGFDHFRLANHPDGLTHGFIGGNETDHWIDLVGRRQDLVPPAAPLVPKTTP